MKNNPIEFKGNIFTLSVLYIKSHIIHVVKDSILKTIEKFPCFFKSTPIVLNVSYLTNPVDWQGMKKAIISTGLHIIGISGFINHILKSDILKSGIPVISEEKYLLHKMHISKHKEYSLKNQNKSKIISTPVRSGQTIYVHKSDLIIINNVNAGAELIADGNIHIYGTMRGRALAGVNGDKTRRIFCTHMFAELFSIAGEYLLMDQIPKNMLGQPVYIFLQDNVISVYPLS